MSELAIVIPTFRRHAILARTLDHLARQSAPADRFEVIVVDDPAGDDPGAVEAAIDAERRPYRVRQLHVGRPDNVSAKRNLGWRSTDAPLIMFLGDDILAEETLVDRHLGWHGDRPREEMAMLGHVRWADELPRTTFMRWLDRGIQFDYERLEGDEAGWGMFYTSNVSVKRSLLERAGGFDEERFPFIYEDTDLGWRLGQAGMRLMHDRSARAEHLHAPTLDEWKRRMSATARAERRWHALHPELEPYFESLFRKAAQAPPARSSLTLPLARVVGPGVPLLGEPLWWRVDLHFRQELAPGFLRAWDEAAADAARLSRTS